ncbi:MAG: hypothetical protein KDK10_12085 [Maritimibacter sp.]|nr:hypothetical protein [Maritimibacter sp.]
MNPLSTFAPAAILAVSVASAALADSPTPYYAPETPTYDFAAQPMPQAKFEGAYLGASGALAVNFLPAIDTEFGAFAGYNFAVSDRVIAGAEIDASYNPNSLWLTSAFTGTLDGRLGYTVTDDLMVYGRAGGGYTTGGTGSAVWDVGGGAEYFVNDGVAVRGELDRTDPFAGGMQTQLNAKLGIIMDF